MSLTAEAVQERTTKPTPKPLGGSLPFSLPAAIAVVIGYAPLVALHLRGLWRREQYQYFPFVIAAFIYLLVTRYQNGRALRTSGERLPIVTGSYCVAWLLLAVATLIQSPWLAIVSLNILLAGLLISLGQTRHIVNLLGIWLLVWLLVPLPFDVDTRLVVKLQGLSSRISSGILDMWGVRHLMSGNVLQLPDKQFFVDEACSGIVSVMSVIACGLIWVVWKNRSLLHVVLLILAGVGWAISLNVARICIITFAHAWWDVDLSAGWQHKALGLTLFSLTFVALISTDRILEFMLQPIESQGEPTPSTRQNPLIRVWNRVVQLGNPLERQAARAVRSSSTSAGLSAPPDGNARFGGNPLMFGGFALLGAVSLVPIAISTHGNFQAVEHAQQIERDFLPERMGTLVLKNFESHHRPAQHELGDYSKTFTYEDEATGQTYMISFDYPFSGGWHELCVCYKNTGWTLLNRKVELPEVNDEWPVITGEFERSGTEHGYLAFSNFNADALGMSPPTDLIFWQPWRRLRRRLLTTVSEDVFQVQVWTGSETAIDESSRELVDNTLLEVRERFREYFEKR